MYAIAKSLCCTPEANIASYVNCTPIKKKVKHKLQAEGHVERASFPGEGGVSIFSRTCFVVSSLLFSLLMIV